MIYKDLFMALDRQVEADREKLIESAKEKARAILQEAEQDIKKAEKTFQEELAKEEQLGKKGAAKKSKSTPKNTHLTKLILGVKYKFFEQAIYLSRKQLNELAKKSDYQQVLKKLIKECVETFPEVDRLLVNSRDVSLAKKILHELKLNLKIKAADNVSAGVIAVSADEKLSVCNTLDFRLDKVIPSLSPQISEILYG